MPPGYSSFVVRDDNNACIAERWFLGCTFLTWERAGWKQGLFIDGFCCHFSAFRENPEPVTSGKYHIISYHRSIVSYHISCHVITSGNSNDCASWRDRKKPTKVWPRSLVNLRRIVSPCPSIRLLLHGTWHYGHFHVVSARGEIGGNTPC